jgi:hypothetical protein
VADKKRTPSEESDSEKANRSARLHRVLKRKIWPSVPAEVTRAQIRKADEEAILGFGETCA